VSPTVPVDGSVLLLITGKQKGPVVEIPSGQMQLAKVWGLVAGHSSTIQLSGRVSTITLTQEVAPAPQPVGQHF
jgi:hypothetical protein